MAVMASVFIVALIRTLRKNRIARTSPAPRDLPEMVTSTSLSDYSNLAAQVLLNATETAYQYGIVCHSSIPMIPMAPKIEAKAVKEPESEPEVKPQPRRIDEPDKRVMEL